METEHTVEPEKSKHPEVGPKKENLKEESPKVEDRQSVLQDTFEDFKEEDSNHVSRIYHKNVVY